MKNKIILLTILLSLHTIDIHAQCGSSVAKTTKATSIGIVIYSNDSETIWNALRFANYSVSTGDTVSIFLLGKGVDLDTIESNDVNIKEQTETFIKSGGKILACGTCLQSRNNSNPKVCSISTMSDLYDLVRKSQIVLTF
jgi:hypothetical protein